jgi:hypothetical protein
MVVMVEEQLLMDHLTPVDQADLVAADLLMEVPILLEEQEPLVLQDKDMMVLRVME